MYINKRSVIKPDSFTFISKNINFNFANENEYFLTNSNLSSTQKNLYNKYYGDYYDSNSGLYQIILAATKFRRVGFNCAEKNTQVKIINGNAITQPALTSIPGKYQYDTEGKSIFNIKTDFFESINDFYIENFAIDNNTTNLQIHLNFNYSDLEFLGIKKLTTHDFTSNLTEVYQAYIDTSSTYLSSWIDQRLQLNPFNKNFENQNSYLTRIVRFGDSSNEPYLFNVFIASNGLLEYELSEKIQFVPIFIFQDLTTYEIKLIAFKKLNSLNQNIFKLNVYDLFYSSQDYLQDESLYYKVKTPITNGKLSTIQPVLLETIMPANPGIIDDISFIEITPIDLQNAITDNIAIPIQYFDVYFGNFFPDEKNLSNVDDTSLNSIFQQQKIGEDFKTFISNNPDKDALYNEQLNVVNNGKFFVKNSLPVNIFGFELNSALEYASINNYKFLGLKLVFILDNYIPYIKNAYEAPLVSLINTFNLNLQTKAIFDISALSLNNKLLNLEYFSKIYFLPPPYLFWALDKKYNLGGIFLNLNLSPAIYPLDFLEQIFLFFNRHFITAQKIFYSPVEDINIQINYKLYNNNTLLYDEIKNLEKNPFSSFETIFTIYNGIFTLNTENTPGLYKIYDIFNDSTINSIFSSNANKIEVIYTFDTNRTYGGVLDFAVNQIDFIHLKEFKSKDVCSLYTYKTDESFIKLTESWINYSAEKTYINVDNTVGIIIVDKLLEVIDSDIKLLTGELFLDLTSVIQSIASLKPTITIKEANINVGNLDQYKDYIIDIAFDLNSLTNEELLLFMKYFKLIEHNIILTFELHIEPEGGKSILFNDGIIPPVEVNVYEQGAIKFENKILTLSIAFNPHIYFNGVENYNSPDTFNGILHFKEFKIKL